MKYKVVRLLQGYFLNAFISETGLGSVNEFLVFKYFVISTPPKSWDIESSESSFIIVPGRQRVSKTISASTGGKIDTRFARFSRKIC